MLTGRYDLDDVREGDDQLTRCDSIVTYFTVVLLCICYVGYISESYCYHLRKPLQQKKGLKDALAVIRQYTHAYPIIWWRAISYHYARRSKQVRKFLRLSIILGEQKTERTKYSLFKIVIHVFVNKTLIIFHFLCQSSSHYVIKSSTKNGPNLRKKCRPVISFTLLMCESSFASNKKRQIEQAELQCSESF